MPVKTYSLIKPEELASSSEPVVEADFPNLHIIIEQMKEIVRSRNGVAVAGPQVGFNKQMFVVCQPGEENAWDVCINPVIMPTKARGKVVGEEGCLSFPGKLFRVHRWKSCSVKWKMPVYDEKTGVVTDLHTMKNKLEGGWARIAQHEYDHLHGKTVNVVGEVIDQRLQLMDVAKRAGLVYDEEKGQLFAKDPETGALVPVDPQAALEKARREAKKEKVKVAKKELWEQREAAKKRREQKRKRERSARKKGRRRN